jgi:hypothetical protein
MTKTHVKSNTGVGKFHVTQEGGYKQGEKGLTCPIDIHTLLQFIFSHVAPGWGIFGMVVYKFYQ